MRWYAQAQWVTGMIDVVAPVEELPDKIIAYLQHAPLIAKSSHLTPAFPGRLPDLTWCLSLSILHQSTGYRGEYLQLSLFFLWCLSVREALKTDLIWR
jgi:hypothetical protein